jgi:hypothetical protein
VFYEVQVEVTKKSFCRLWVPGLEWGEHVWASHSLQLKAQACGSMVDRVLFVDNGNG